MSYTKAEKDAAIDRMAVERLDWEKKQAIIEKYKPQILAVQNASNKLLQDRQGELKAVIDKQNAEIAALEK